MRLIVRAGLVPWVLVLAACGGVAAPDAAPRPVLVVQPAGGGAAPAAYAGDVRARVESPLSFRVAGSLVRRRVDVGDRVARGDILAELDPGDLHAQANAAAAQSAAADAQLARARADHARHAELARQQLVSRSALDAQTATLRAAEGEARAARAQREVAGNQAGYAQLRAPRAGVIVQRHAEAGQVVAAGQPVFTLAGLDGREIAIAIPEAHVAGVRVGQPVEVELWSQSGQRMAGRIRELSPAADPHSRTFAARVALPAAAAARAALGQSARVYVAASGGRPLAVPLSAVRRGADGTAAVWVVQPSNRALVSVPVRLGPYGEYDVPVLAGLAPDAWVVAAGGHLLHEGQVVAPVDRDNRPVLRGDATPGS